RHRRRAAARARARARDRPARATAVRCRAARPRGAFTCRRCGNGRAVRADRGGVVRIGCSGWNYAHWRELVYPKGLPPARWLRHYATLFDTVEVNTTFYRLPTSKAVA